MKAVKFYEMKKGKFYCKKDFIEEEIKLFYWLDDIDRIVCSKSWETKPTEDEFNIVSLTKDIINVTFVEWEEPKKLFQQTGEDWERLKDFITDKDPESYHGGSQLIYEILQEIERIEKRRKNNENC